jgi:hypothetical protein
LARVSPGNPGGSTLYIKINGGSMSQYADATLVDLVNQWILDGAVR